MGGEWSIELLSRKNYFASRTFTQPCSLQSPVFCYFSVLGCPHYDCVPKFQKKVIQKLCSKVVFKQLCSINVPKIVFDKCSKNCVQKLCSKIVFQNCVPKLCSKIVFQNCVPKLCYKKVCQMYSNIYEKRVSKCVINYQFSVFRIQALRLILTFCDL